MTSRNIIDVTGRIDAVEDQGTLYAGVQSQQEIPDSFTQRLRDIEDNRKRGAEMSLAASIPVIFVEKWMRDGFNIYQEPLSAIEAKCHKEGLEAFLVKH
jgi:hypothetical protein